jgi:hypothetical protein
MCGEIRGPAEKAQVSGRAPPFCKTVAKATVVRIHYLPPPAQAVPDLRKRGQGLDRF